MTHTYRVRRRRLRVQLAMAGVTTGLAVWHLFHSGDWLWSLAAGLGVLAFIGTHTQLEDARRDYEAAQLMTDHPRDVDDVDAVGPIRDTADETTNRNGDHR